jgi:prepilin-type N-terminal cleavage/methylation domain-containing protein
MKAQTPVAHVRAKSSAGFSLIEMLVTTVIFTLVAGMIFSLLMLSQKRYRTEKESLGSFQQANLAMDQIARDIHTTGYPPTNSFNTAIAAANPGKIAMPFPWSPTYPAVPCTVDVNCLTPTSYDLLLEEDLGNGNGVQWIRYSLQGTTLMRAVTSKVVGADPMATTTPLLAPYLENVMNNCTAGQMAIIKQAYPSMFPGNAAIPLFTFTIPSGQPQQPASITDVNVSLIVQAPLTDLQTKQVRVAVLTGQASVFNPNQ